MKSHRVAVFAACCSMILVLSCASPPQQEPAPDTRAADEAAIHALELAWSAAAGAKQVDATVAYYADDATVLASNAPMATDKQSIRQTWTDMFAIPGFSISWESTKVEVSRSSDLAYTIGTYQMGMNGPDGKPMTDHGKYATIWKKQPDGNWKAIVDAFSTDMPAAAAVTK